MTAAPIVFVLAAVACVVAHLAILVSVVRSRSSTTDPAVPRPRLFVEIIWALVPAILLALVLTATWQRINDPGSRAPSVMMKVAR